MNKYDIVCNDCGTKVGELTSKEVPKLLNTSVCYKCDSVNLKAVVQYNVQPLNKKTEFKKVAYDIFINNKSTNMNAHEGFVFEKTGVLIKDNIAFRDKCVECFVKIIKNKENFKKVIGEDKI